MSDAQSEIRDHNQQQHKPTKSSSPSSFSVFLSLFSCSFRIFFQNKHILLSILLFLALPLSFLLFSLSLSSRPLKRHIFHLESVALLTSTSFESRHLLRESREESISLLRLKLLYSFPSSVFSLLSFISAVHVSSISPPHRPSFLSTAAAIGLSWKRVVVTSLCSYTLFILYIQLPQLLAVTLRNHPPGQPTHLGDRFGYRGLLDGSVGFRTGGVGVGGEIRVGSDSDRVGFDGGTEVLLVVRYLHAGGCVGVDRESV
ncbi:Detected protein of unknown function [Hibiscus syriacus]|uniref:Transmembrane protein n=1 Tax=Hibiscus syriacus TaxID=106335 RepID=A0A6A2ZKK3_HIBSY|nr:Detected protein of unknown function [Hibiscus syriacus]